MGKPSQTKEERRQNILTRPLLPLLIRTAIPTMVGMLVMMIYNLTDTFWIGRLNDKSMTAAIGIVFSFVSVVQALGFWFGYGSGNTMSRRIGEGDEAEAAVISSTGIVLALITGICSLILLFFMKPLSVLLGGGVSPELLGYTQTYLMIMMLAVPFSLFSTTVYNQLRLCGNVKDGMLGLLAGMLLNILLDPVFILAFHMGIAGAGLATLLGQAAGGAVLIRLSNMHGNIPVRLKGWSLSKGRLYHILAGGAPNFSRQAITSIAGVLLNQTAARYGEDLIAALTVSTRVAALGYLLMIGFGQGFQPICAMNYGAKQYRRVKKALDLTITIGTAFLAAAAVLIALFSRQLVSVFVSDPDVVQKGVTILHWQCISLPFLGVYAISSMYMQNIGQYFKSLMISIARQGYFYIPLLYILSALCGEFGICLLQPIADILSAILGIAVMVPQVQRMMKNPGVRYN